jgi:transcription elongation factor GreB
VVADDDGVELEYQLVGEDETDVPARRISWRSPVGAALLGRTIDDEVRVRTPAGLRTLTIVAVRYGDGVGDG